MDSIDLSTMTDDQIAALESGDGDRVRGALGIKDAPAPAPAANANEPAPPAPAEDAPHRISVKALPAEDRVKMVKVLDLVRSGKTTAEAMAQIFGNTPPAAPAPSPKADEPAPPAPAPAVPEVVATAQAAVDEKLAEIKQLRAEYADTTDAMLELTDLKVALNEAKREAATLAQSQAQFETAQEASRSRVLDKYADLITESGDFMDYCDAEIVLAERKADPILNSPDWPEKIGQRVADKYFKGRAAQSSDSPGDKSTVPPAPRQTMRLPGTPIGDSFAPGTLTPETAFAEIDNLSSEESDALLKELSVLEERQRRRF
jgi:hypothetical protein